jgi:hypothetical protein
MILYSPNSSLINGVISKSNSTFVLLDTVTTYAYAWSNVSDVLTSYFLANGTGKKVKSLRRVSQSKEEFFHYKTNYLC